MERQKGQSEAFLALGILNSILLQSSDLVAKLRILSFQSSDIEWEELILHFDAKFQELQAIRFFSGLKTTHLESGILALRATKTGIFSSEGKLENTQGTIDAEIDQK